MGRVIAAFTQFFDDAGDPLENGWLEFLESGSTATQKNTYADSNLNVVNSNPVQLDAAGRCPNVFGTGSYKVISYTKNIEDEADVGSQIQVFDPVTVSGESSGGGGSGLEAWVVTTTYSLGDIVTHSEKIYRSLINANVGLNPAIETASWEEIEFLPIYNENVTYEINQLCHYEGNVYVSLASANSDNQPDESPTWWRRLGNNIYKTATKTTDYEILPSERDYLFILSSAASADSQFDLPVVDATNDLFKVSIYNASDYNLTIDALGGLDTWIDTSGEIILPKGAYVELIYVHSITTWLPLNNLGPILGGQDIGTSTKQATGVYTDLLYQTKMPDNEYLYFGTDDDSIIYHTGTTFNIYNTTGDVYIRCYRSGGSVVFGTGAVPYARWQINGDGDLLPVSVTNVDIGNATYMVGSIFQKDNAYHYFGNDQDAYIIFDGALLAIANGTGIWVLGSSGNLLPNVTNSYDIGSSSYRVDNIWVNGPPDNDYKAANKAYVDSSINAIVGEFATNANGNPNLSDTTFGFYPAISKGSWESIGPTGAPSVDNEWSALDDVPSDADWIEIHCSLYYGSQAASGIALCYATIRGYGSSESGILIGRVDSYVATGGDINTGRGRSVVVVKVPVDSENRFEGFWTESNIGLVSNVAEITLVGYGYNKS
jgi:hypothetical protein